MKLNKRKILKKIIILSLLERGVFSMSYAPELKKAIKKSVWFMNQRHFLVQHVPEIKGPDLSEIQERIKYVENIPYTDSRITGKISVTQKALELIFDLLDKANKWQQAKKWLKKE